MLYFEDKKKQFLKKSKKLKPYFLKFKYIDYDF